MRGRRRELRRETGRRERGLKPGKQLPFPQYCGWGHLPRRAVLPSGKRPLRLCAGKGGRPQLHPSGRGSPRGQHHHRDALFPRQRRLHPGHSHWEPCFLLIHSGCAAKAQDCRKRSVFVRIAQKMAFFSRKNTGKNDKNITKIYKKTGENQEREGRRDRQDNPCNLAGNVLGYLYRGMEIWEKQETSELICRHGRKLDASAPVSLFFGKRLLKK